MASNRTPDIPSASPSAQTGTISDRSYKKIEEYGVVGNLETCALVGRDGAVDWLCLPELGSPSVFAALLDRERGGFFQIRPVDGFESYQQYAGETNVLRTVFVTVFGTLTVTDFMPIIKAGGGSRRAFLRKVESSTAGLRISVRFSPRFSYGREVPRFRRSSDVIVAETGGIRLSLRTPVPLEIAEGDASGVCELEKKRALWFALEYGTARPAAPGECRRLLASTERYWKGWEEGHRPHKLVFRGPLYNLVVRSGMILKLLSNPRTGSIAAAATTSLPETLGGVRNWDYRYAWIRDASFTVQALFHLGHVGEAKEFTAWVEDILDQEGGPENFRIMYGLHGETDLRESTIDVLRGYENSAPVRVGNAASTQSQHDVYGELINVMYETTRYGLRISKRAWRNLSALVEHVRTIWREPDSGIWEVRGERRHYVYSKVMCWVAVDRGIKIAEKKGFAFPRADWERTREEIRASVLENGIDLERRCFVQSYGSKSLDAACLLVPLMGFLPATDPRVRGTIDAVIRELAVNETFVRRYGGADGLPGDEGAFVICTFWLIKALLVSGRTAEAKRYFSNILRYASPLGLFAEEVDYRTGRQLGNFPQAFSHVGLVNATLYLGMAKGRTPKAARPMGTEPAPSPSTDGKPESPA